MEKVLLMVPLVSLMKGVPSLPDLGLGYLARALREAGYTIDLMSWNKRCSVAEFEQTLRREKYDCIGIKSFTKDVSAAKQTMNIITECSPQTMIVLGGPHASTNEPVHLAREFPKCDYFIQGDGEFSLTKLLNCFLNEAEATTEQLAEISGLVWRVGDRVEHNPVYLEPDLDKFNTPLWEIMDPASYPTIRFTGSSQDGFSAPIIVTRGCSSNCSFCAAYKINGKKTRVRSVKSVLQEIELLYFQYHVRHFYFHDTRYTHYKETVKGVCQGIIDRQLDISWDCNSFDNLSTLDDELLQLMRKAGCVSINISVETASDKIRRRVRKIGSINEIREAISRIKKAGIGIRGFFMIGFPGETKADMLETINFASSLPAEHVQFEIVSPHPGTEFLNDLKSKYNIESIDWFNFDVYSSPYPMSDLSSRELYSLLMRIRFKKRLARKMANIYRLLGLRKK